MRRSLNYKESRVAYMKRVAKWRDQERSTLHAKAAGFGQRARGIQPLFEMSRRLPVGLDGDVRRASVEALNQTLAANLEAFYSNIDWNVVDRSLKPIA